MCSLCSVFVFCVVCFVLLFVCCFYIGKQTTHRVYHALTPERLEVLQLLIDYGADVTARNDKRNTPMHVACALNNRKAVRLLIFAGADIMASNWAQEKPYQVFCCSVLFVLFSFLFFGVFVVLFVSLCVYIHGVQMAAEGAPREGMLAYINACYESYQDKLESKQLYDVPRSLRCYYRSLYDVMDASMCCFVVLLVLVCSVLCCVFVLLCLLCFVMFLLSCVVVCSC